MAQLSKRSLRERRAPKSFDSDNEQVDPWGYSKPSYSKQQRNPSQQLNSDAKLFVRYLSAINKSLREYEEQHRKKQIENIKEPLTIKDKNINLFPSQTEMRRRHNQASKDARAESVKKQKQSYNFKAQTYNHDPREQPTPESFLNKCKALNTESAQKMLNIQYGISKNKNQTQDPPRIKPQRLQMGIQGNESNNSFKKAQLQGSTKQEQKSASQNQFYNYSKEKQKRIQQVQANLNIPKPTMSQAKIFKRSAYHVAIAYHIYMIQVRQKGAGMEMDPTAKARKLKQGMNR